jgi:flagellar basal-body rod protein FlgC
MTDYLSASIRAASAGLAFQSTRMRVISENIANADATSSVAGGDPYRRKTISFETELDAGEPIRIAEIGVDKRPFNVTHEPGHPAADAAGFVKRPNVELMIEMADLREANRTYLANLQMVKQAREAIAATIDLLRT